MKVMIDDNGCRVTIEEMTGEAYDYISLVFRMGLAYGYSAESLSEGFAEYLDENYRSVIESYFPDTQQEELESP